MQYTKNWAQEWKDQQRKSLGANRRVLTETEIYLRDTHGIAPNTSGFPFIVRSYYNAKGKHIWPGYRIAELYGWEAFLWFVRNYPKKS